MEFVNLRKIANNIQQRTGNKVVFISLVYDNTENGGIKYYICYFIPNFKYILDDKYKKTENYTYYIDKNIVCSAYSIFYLYNLICNYKGEKRDLVIKSLISNKFVVYENSLHSFKENIEEIKKDYYYISKETKEKMLKEILHLSIDKWSDM